MTFSLYQNCKHITDAVQGPGLDAGLDKLDEIFWAPVRKFEYGQQQMKRNFTKKKKEEKGGDHHLKKPIIK